MDTAGYLNRVTRWPHQAGENQAEWSRQVIAKTKHLRGESHMRAKFSDRQVSEMRHMHEVLGVSRVDIASAFGCSYWTVRDILTGRTRKTAPQMPDGVTLAKKRKGPTVIEGEMTMKRLTRYAGLIAGASLLTSGLERG